MRTLLSPRPAAVVAATVLLAATACGSVSPPEVTYYAAGESVAEGPQVYCSLDFTDCEPAGRAAELSVPPGSPLQISLPKEIADAPWRMITTYADEAGELQALDVIMTPGERIAVTVRLPRSTDVLQFVEIQLPSGATDTDGITSARAAWSVQNTYTPDA